MATIYVSSVDGNNADSGADWTNAKATIAGALLLATGADNIIYVDSAHAYSATSAAITWNMPNAGNVSIISVNRSNGAWLAGASETVGTSGFSFTIGSANFTNSYYFYGLTISGAAGNSASNTLAIGTANTAALSLSFNTCTVINQSTNSSAGVTAFLWGCASGASSIKPLITFRNSVINISNFATQKGISVRVADVMINNCTFGYSGGAKPTILFTSGTGSSLGKSNVRIIDCDMSGYNTTGGTYFEVTNWSEVDVIVRNCKLSATPGLTTGTWLTNVSSLTVINTDSGDTGNVFEYRNRLGTITENTSIYANSGGKFAGSGISWEIVTSSSCSEYEPFITPWIMRWLESTSSSEVGFRLVHDSATDLHDRNTWQHIEYVSSSTFPQGTLISGRNAQPFDGTAVDWTNDSETWTGTGGFGTANTQTIASTFTPGEKSLIRGRLLLGVASKTLYLDPALRITGGLSTPSVRWTNEGSFNVEPSAGGPIFGGMIIK